MLFKFFINICKKMTADRLDYRNKIILAPMVRVGTLPTRLLALEMGADIVYTEELIDLKLVKCVRNVNDILGTIDYVDPSDGTVSFRTCNLEKSRLVLQMGTSDADRALAVGKKIQQDISGLDINMGCPKEFSIKGGMGVALLAQPDKACHILKTLVDNLDIPVTCKIRILPSVEDTIELVKKLTSTGIAAIGIHARTRDERPRHNPHPEVIKEVAKHVSIPVICNGGSRDIEKYEDILKFRNLCGASSIMVARAAQMNVSIFRKGGLLPMDDLICKYLKLSVDYDNPPHNTKYGIQSIMREQQETPRGKLFLQSQTMQHMCDIWNMGDYCRQKELELHNKGNMGRRQVVPGQVPDSDILEVAAKKAKTDESVEDDEKDIIEENVAFLRCNYNIKTDHFPKTQLYVFANKNDKLPPTYVTEGKDKLFRSICTFDDKRYRSTFWQKNKKQAEQAAALVCLKNIGLVTTEELIKNGSILR
ncbi:tRNA-dihydrouridine(20) synthase [NAD(P)+]-like isoform X1 [Stomoxys calcitrans]|uniref:DRBM domain-containing protein n=1 Tax=Stomoxys calcitrans TaxID=35570 RepID=A0A1I8NNM8_STOCA|nr:tRNA-dihydrouridine(20) synthase [NAD(P)+]-like isoform X1 [Stomoxys calcitrans]